MFFNKDSDDSPPAVDAGEKQPRGQWMSKMVPASVAARKPESELSPHDDDQDYLTGVRGCLAIMCFLWMFMQTFVPAATAHSANTEGPGDQLALRKSLSILFWNDSLIYSSFIFLSARTICLPFLLDSTKVRLASSVLRRGLRLWFPVAASLITIYIVFTRSLATLVDGSLQLEYLTEFANKTSNAAISSDLYVLPNSLANFNAIFDLFWQTHAFNVQGGNWAFPTQTLWIISAIFQQSYTVYATMVIVPYTRKSWRLWGAFVFIITAWWVYSWAWFSVSGLLLADLVVNHNLQAKMQNHKIITMAVALFCLAAGYFMMFFWEAARPDLQPEEIKYHTGLYDTGGLWLWNDPSNPQLRADNYLVIVGFYILLEMFSIMQKVFRNPVFVFLGKRSYSYFLIQGTIIYTLGVKLALNKINEESLSSYPQATGIAFISTLLVTFGAGEIFYWLFDVTSQKFARLFFAWIRE